MTLRIRIALAAGVAVALTVVALVAADYAATRAELRRQIDQALSARAQPFVTGPPVGVGGDRSHGLFPGPGLSRGLGLTPRPGPDAGAGPGAGPGAGTGPENRSAPPLIPGHLGGGASAGDPDQGAGLDRLLAAPPAARAPAYGGASGFVQFVLPDGRVLTPPNSTSALPVDGQARRIAASGIGRRLADSTVDHVHLRVLTLGRGSQGAVQATRPLTEVDHVLSRLLLVVVIAGLGGIVLAAVLGALVARTALAPIARFTRRTERLTEASVLTDRLEVTGRDELARLAQSFNATRDALERSVAAQRHLVADASHELRTPIASLRANIQVLEDADRLAPAELAGLRKDIIDELDELTALVSDVVELARGGRPAAERDDVRLDDIVRSLAERAERRGGKSISLRLELEPTLVRGEPERVSRAISNVLDNARAWSPPGGVIEVALAGGVLRVRDHGPGFGEHDLAHVFDRFYRADASRGQPGSGLGLAIVRQAVEDHGGWARAANASDGGAVIELSFGAPMTPAEGQPLVGDAVARA